MAGAGVTLTGFDSVLGKLDAIARGDFTREVVKVLAAEALTQVQLGFRQGRSPEGDAWAPPLLRSGQPLRDTGRLQASFTASIRGLKVGISSNAVYAATHQFGNVVVPVRAKWLRFSAGRGRARQWFTKSSVTIPARPMLPTGGEVGPIWASAFDKAFSLAWRNFMR